jgi:hypothetical protein
MRDAGMMRRFSSFGSPLSPHLLFLVALSVASGCGYQVGRLIEYRKVKLAMFDNATERRIHEFDLTAAVAREMSSEGIAVNSPEAEVELVGRIRDFREPAVVTTGQDEVLISSVSIELEISLVRRSDRKVLWTDARSEAASFATQRGESRETARQEVFSRLARWTVTKLEKDW